MIKLLVTSWLIVVFLYPTILFVYSKISQSRFSHHAKRNLTWVWVVLFLGGPALGLMSLGGFTMRIVIMATLLVVLYPASFHISVKLRESLSPKNKKTLKWLWLALAILGPTLGHVVGISFLYGSLPRLDFLNFFLTDWPSLHWQVLFRTRLFPFYTISVILVFIWSCISWIRRPNYVSWFWSFLASWVLLSFMAHVLGFGARYIR